MTMTNKGAIALRQLVHPRPRVSRATLAAEMKLKSPAAVGEWLRGKNCPSPAAMRWLEDHYGIPMRDWLEPADESANQLPDDVDGEDE